MIEMMQSNHPNGSICGTDFGYDTKMEGYLTIVSDIPKLYDVAL
jgi:hypothetical protein